MRTLAVLLYFFSFEVCLSQTDSMIVEMKNGTIKSYVVSSINQLTFSGIPTTVVEQELISTILSSFTLHQNYPNPFNPSTTIQFEIPMAGRIQIGVFDVQGRLVRTFENREYPAGNHRTIWDGRNDQGVSVSSGVYFCRVVFNGQPLTKKLVMLK